MKTQTTEHRQQNTDNRTQQKVLPHRLGSGIWVLGSNKGLTLIEVLVAVTILAIGLLGVALMQVTSISGTTYSREMATATDLGQDMLEKLMATMPYTCTACGITGGNHPTVTDVTNFLAPALSGNANNIIDERGLWPARAAAIGTTAGPLLYTRTWTVTDNLPATNMKEIAVTVSWTEKGSVATTRSIVISGIKVSE